MVAGWKAVNLGLPDVPTWKTLPALSQYVFVYVMLPVVYAVSLWNCIKAPRERSFVNWEAIALLTLCGLALLLEVAQSINWLRVYCVAIPGVILLIWNLSQGGKFQHYATRFLRAGVVCLALLQTWSRHHQQSWKVVLPAGMAATTSASAEKLNWLRDHTKPGDFFFQAGWPGLYLPLDLHNPVYLDALELGDQTRPEYVELSIRQLSGSRVQYVLWSPRLNSPDPYYGAEQYHLAPFRDYLNNHYHLASSFSDQDEIWERNQ